MPHSRTAMTLSLLICAVSTLPIAATSQDQRPGRQVMYAPTDDPDLPRRAVPDLKWVPSRLAPVMARDTAAAVGPIMSRDVTAVSCPHGGGMRSSSNIFHMAADAPRLERYFENYHDLSELMAGTRWVLEGTIVDASPGLKAGWWPATMYEISIERVHSVDGTSPRVDAVLIAADGAVVGIGDEQFVCSNMATIGSGLPRDARPVEGRRVLLLVGQLEDYETEAGSRVAVTEYNLGRLLFEAEDGRAWGWDAGWEPHESWSALRRVVRQAISSETAVVDGRSTQKKVLSS